MLEIEKKKTKKDKGNVNMHKFSFERLDPVPTSSQNSTEVFRF